MTTIVRKFFIDDEPGATFWDQFERFDDYVIERAMEALSAGEGEAGLDEARPFSGQGSRMCSNQHAP
jgi:hypothetical protein